MVMPSLAPGFIFGTFLLLAQINLAIGMPLMFFAILFFQKYIRLDAALLDIKIALAVKLGWIISIWYLYKATGFFTLAQIVAPDVILFVLLFFRADKDFVKGLAIPLSGLLLLDLFFNVSIHTIGTDLMGRGASLRPGDILPRVGGVFGHPFYSINIALVGIFCGLILKNKSITALSVVNLLINGTFKSPILLLTFLIFYLATALKAKLHIIIAIAVIFASFIIWITVYSANSQEYGGNILRVLAWELAIENILENPFLGTHNFRHDALQDMSMDIIADYGIAESTYLQYAVDFGILAAILHFYIIFRILQLSYSRYSGVPVADNLNRLRLVLASVIFCDIFFGTFFGSLLTVCFSLIFIQSDSFRRNV